jgi:F0F1-type ATP synthase assembly protein I
MAEPEVKPPAQISPNKTQYALNMGLAGFAGTVGVVTIVIIVVALIAGLFLDRQLNTKPLFTILILLGSVPVTIFIMFRLALGAVSKMKMSQPTQKKEETSSERSNT